MKTLLHPSAVDTSGDSPESTQRAKPHKASALSNLKHDLFSSLVVALVALPLSLGIAIASGAPTVMAGVIACAVGGIVTGLVGGAPLQVSGPAAGLTLVVYTLIQNLGWGVVCAATAVAGLLQIVLGFARIGKFCLAISPSVVHGMLAGIGVVITLSQIHFVLGGAPESSPWKNLMELPAQLLNLSGPATLIGLVTIAILIAWTYLPAKAKLIPGPLVAVATGTILSLVLALDVQRVSLPGSLISSLQLPELPPMEKLGAFLLACVTITLVASTESLLCAVATDRLHSGRRADLDRELLGQGLGNFASGLASGLPVTGVIVRSSANIRAGARTKYSAVLHGVWIILTVLCFREYLELIPLAALAGLLVFVGLQLVNPHHIRELIKHRESAVYFITLFAVVFWDLLGGVALGLIASAFTLFWRLSRARITVEVDEQRWHVQIEGSATFIAVPEIIDALGAITPGADVEIDLMVDFIDHAALDAIHNWRVVHENTGGRVDIDEVHANPAAEEESWSRVVVQKFDQPLPKRRIIRRFLDGVAHFNRSSNATGPMLAKLAREGQSPKILFVGCSDSRLVPTLITNSGPGELFKLRNVGNLIPKELDTSVGATLEFGIGVLDIELVVVCGHSDCGAMKALLSENASAENGALSRWLVNGADSLQRFKRDKRAITVSPGTLHAHDSLAQFNAVQQLENLRKYPIIREREAQGRLEIYAVYFDIAASKTYIFDPVTGSYVLGDTLAERFERADAQAAAVAQLDAV